MPELPGLIPCSHATHPIGTIFKMPALAYWHPLWDNRPLMVWYKVLNYVTINGKEEMIVKVIKTERLGGIGW
jgi:hypothetical protein